jgi:hypothetical protein
VIALRLPPQSASSLNMHYADGDAWIVSRPDARLTLLRARQMAHCAPSSSAWRCKAAMAARGQPAL